MAVRGFRRPKKFPQVALLRRHEIATPLTAIMICYTMPGLIHDGPFRRSRDCRRRCVPGSEGVPSIFGSVQAGAARQLLYDASYIDTGQPAQLHVPMPIDGAEQSTDANANLFAPRLHGPDRARQIARQYCPSPPCLATARV